LYIFFEFILSEVIGLARSQGIVNNKTGIEENFLEG
jgi:hypothetical protein